MKKQWHEIVVEFAKLAIKQSCGKFAKLAQLILGLLLNICAGQPTSGNREKQPDFPFVEKHLSRGQLFCLAAAVLFPTLFEGTVVLAKRGCIPYITIQGQFQKFTNDEANEKITVLLFENGQTACEWTTVDKDGRFQFNWLKRRVYRMVVYQPGTNWFDIQEFTGDLRNNDLWSFRYDLNEKLATERFIVLKSAKCFFDTGQSGLDQDARNTIDAIFATAPTNRYRLIIFGHADETGGQQRNLELSRDRAINTFTAVTNYGASGGNAIVAFFGSERPAVYGDSAQQLAANRRAEIMVVSRSQVLSGENSK